MSKSPESLEPQVDIVYEWGTWRVIRHFKPGWRNKVDYFIRHDCHKKGRWNLTVGFSNDFRCDQCKNHPPKSVREFKESMEGLERLK